jgi:D-sedoheptulose 7-phosphate isomerase
MAIPAGTDLVAQAEMSFASRRVPGQWLIRNAGVVADVCQAMAGRFRLGGKLIAFGNGGPATDAQHVSVEFVHPVIVGKRALPAVSLTNDVATVTGVAKTAGFDEVYAHQMRYLAASEDIALGISVDGRCENVHRALQLAGEMGLLTIALLGGDGGSIARRGAAQHVMVVPTDDPLVVKEIHVTIYHLLWELVHVALDQ